MLNHQSVASNDVELEERIFSQACELSGQNRQQFLRAECGNDQELYHRMKSLLDLDEEPDELFDWRVSGPQLKWSKQIGEGDQVGVYELEQCIGEGGMGKVFQAKQVAPICREVALKIIRNGSNTTQVIRRFEAERETLSLFDHPNVTRILDAGLTDDGLPFFVMELVRGESITNFCNRNCVSLPDRLKLFVDVCRAIHHAHQRGVIHRDIKPSNVMVAMQDQQPVPKVIDFGIAKALSPQDETKENWQVTQFGDLIGTLEYMSPEQIRNDGSGLDVRTDIYSLGVLLYELLTGTVPLNPAADQRPGLMHTLESILEIEAVGPSKCVEQMSHARLKKCECERSTTQLKKTLAGDLDWIVLKALQKEPDLRYQSAAALKDDVLAYLNGDTVSAAAPKLVYRCKKYFAKHRGFCVAGLVVFFVMLFATLFSSYHAIRATHAESQRGLLVSKLQTEGQKLVQALELAEIGRQLQANQLRTKKKELAFSRAVESLARAQMRGFESGSEYPVEPEAELAKEVWIEFLWASGVFTIHNATSQGNYGPSVSSLLPPSVGRTCTWMFEQLLLGGFFCYWNDGRRSEEVEPVMASDPFQQNQGADSELPPEDVGDITGLGFGNGFAMYAAGMLESAGLEMLLPNQSLLDSDLPRIRATMMFSGIEIDQNYQQGYVQNEVLVFCNELLFQQKKIFGMNDIVVANTHDLIGQVHFHCKKFADAETSFREAIAIYRKRQDVERGFASQLWLARAQFRQGTIGQAQKLLKSVEQKLTSYFVTAEDTEINRSLRKLRNRVCFEVID